jgi:hypothetical protein
MILLTLALLATMFLTFTIAGADRGQMRYGLMSGGNPVPAETSTPATVTQGAERSADFAEAVFVPAQTLESNSKLTQQFQTHGI